MCGLLEIWGRVHREMMVEAVECLTSSSKGVRSLKGELVLSVVLRLQRVKKIYFFGIHSVSIWGTNYIQALS